MSRVLSLKSDSMQYLSTIINERGVTSEYTDIEYGERANTAGQSCAVTWRNQHFIFGGGSRRRYTTRITKGKRSDFLFTMWPVDLSLLKKWHKRELNMSVTFQFIWGSQVVPSWTDAFTCAFGSIYFGRLWAIKTAKIVFQQMARLNGTSTSKTGPPHSIPTCQLELTELRLTIVSVSELQHELIFNLRTDNLLAVGHEKLSGSIDKENSAKAEILTASNLKWTQIDDFPYGESL